MRDVVARSVTACHRRSFLFSSASIITTSALRPASAEDLLRSDLLPRTAPPPEAFEAPTAAVPGRVQFFVAQAVRMRAKAIAAGDQAFGAIVVKDDSVIGWGPSRVVADRNPKAHAERVAIMDAQLRLAAVDLGGAVMYSTSQLCPMCEDAAAVAGISRVFWGHDATDAGRPQRR